MNPRKAFFRRLAAPVQVEHTVPPADIVPPGMVMVDTPMSLELEHDARLRHADRIVHRVLIAESLKPEELRNGELMDLCLDLRSTLRPSAPGSEVLREVPPVGIRYAVPVNPGRWV